MLGVDLATQARWTAAYDALNAWRARIEAAGVLVFQMSRVDLEEVRGFSLAEDPVPVIAINTKDAPNARVFTMLHELCHVALRESGICEPDEDRLLPSEERQVEVFCNRVAGAALVPMRDLLNQGTVRGHAGPVWSDEELHTLARRFSASRFVVLRRLLTARRTACRRACSGRSEGKSRWAATGPCRSRRERADLRAPGPAKLLPGPDHSERRFRVPRRPAEAPVKDRAGRWVLMYSVDTSALIDAWRRDYRLSVFPSLGKG
jgi:Zn-dependent peptidase ImmA (M78 family)